jgi:hypothetical protein
MSLPNAPQYQCRPRKDREDQGRAAIGRVSIPGARYQSLRASLDAGRNQLFPLEAHEGGVPAVFQFPNGLLGVRPFLPCVLA